ncbi:hypothetical protein Pfo_002703 [Paulownia fortunei]|nr:hypothetical protein Pfo_002703 [Paulownia fortunei]
MEHKKKYLIVSFLLIFLTQFVNPAISDLHQPKSSKHFVLVHGASHGAWCWYKLVPLLRSSGHNVTALDLAASGINPQQVLDVPFISEYFSPLIQFMASLPPQERVILVGHSYGGFAITQAMEKFPDRISVAVFATALMPGLLTNFSIFNQEIIRSQGDNLDTTYTFDNGPNNPPTTVVIGPRYMAVRFYPLSPIQDWTLATLLVRPLHMYSAEDLQRTLTLSSKNYGSVSRVFIVINQDMVLQKYFQQWMIKQNPPKEVREITGSDHMVMMSKPTELLAQLQDISRKYS